MGVTNIAIWMELPTQMEMANSVFLFAAIDTAVKCSAALPTIGMRMSEMKAFGTPYFTAVSSIEPTTTLPSVDKNRGHTPVSTQSDSRSR